MEEIANKLNGTIKNNIIITDTLKLVFKNNKVEIYLLNYHELCSLSKSKNQYIKTIDITDNNLYKIINDILNTNKVYCNCKEKVN